MASVFQHPQTGNVLLENNVNGKTIRLSTGKKATGRLIGWYKARAEDEFWKLYYQKHKEADQRMTFSEYARYIVDITQSNRNEEKLKRSRGLSSILVI